jgi:taurine dioxygenase|tara:strand:- start:1927 stop:2778 length:852 start_codon:yes stop_codon:yes gene_type:complete
MSYQHIEVKPISGACGAVVSGIDLSQDLDEQRLNEVKRAFHENLVIFFHDQDITEEQHKTFGRKFGTLNIHPRYVPLENHPEIIPIRKDPEHTTNVGGIWHQDLTHLENPPLGSILFALEVPSAGGDTMFANQYLAYEALSKGMKDLLDGMVAIHDNLIQSPKVSAEKNSTRSSKLREDLNEEDEPEMEHPVVVIHPETGRKALYVNSIRTRRFKDMTEEESKPLLNYLVEHSYQPEFTCRFKWRKGSVAFWDNRCLMHFALNDYQGQRRYMNRVTINGKRPV